MNDFKEKPRALGEYAKHLRAVHFTLLITCIGLLVTLLTRVRSDAEYALAQLDQIMSVCNASVWDPRWLEAYVEHSRDPKIFGTRSSLTGVYEIMDPAVQFQLGDALWTLHPSEVPLSKREQEHRSEQFFPTSPDRRPLVIDWPKNIAEFRQFWDALMKQVPVYIAVRIGPGYVINEEQSAPGVTAWDAHEDVGEIGLRVCVSKKLWRVVRRESNR